MTPAECNIGHIYAVASGDYMGEFLVLVEEKEDQCVFLSLPDFHIRDVPKEKYKWGIKHKILDFREKLPKDVFMECNKKYNEIKSSKA